MVVTGPEYPIIQMVDAVNPSNCHQADGQIRIIALGIDLEYSIDNGLNWQDSPIFSNQRKAYRILRN